MQHLRRLALLFALAAGFALTPAPLVAAAQGSASISGLVFIDRNLNGLYDAGEYLLPSAELTLMHGTDATAVQAGSTASGQDGRYMFSGLAAGDYYIKVLLQGEYVFAPFQQVYSHWTKC
jgi:hypothetical protein